VRHVLDNPGWHALRGRQAPLAEWSGNRAAVRYAPEVSPFCAVDDASADAWDGLREFAGGGGVVLLARADPVDAPVGWRDLLRERVTQYVAADLPTRPDLSLDVLGVADASAMVELTALTQPGPFLARTHEMGTYYGLRRAGQLVAMAGERLNLDGWTEISAVCVHPDARREGLGGTLTLAVAHGIRDRGDEAFLHVRDGNDPAHTLYRTIGFQVRREVEIAVFGLAN